MYTFMVIGGTLYCVVAGYMAYSMFQGKESTWKEIAIGVAGAALWPLGLLALWWPR